MWRKCLTPLVEMRKFRRYHFDDDAHLTRLGGVDGRVVQRYSLDQIPALEQKLRENISQPMLEDSVRFWHEFRLEEFLEAKAELYRWLEG